MSFKTVRKLQSVANALQSFIISLYPNPEVVRETTSSEVRAYFKAFDIDILVLDRPYELIAKESVAAFLNLDQISETVYKVNDWDCDNFAFKTFVNFKDWCKRGAFGVVLGINADGGAHAWNWFLIDDNGSLAMVFVEPQTDKVFDYTTEKIWNLII